jgi:hypothetical protein
MHRPVVRWILGAVVGSIALIALGQAYAAIGGS